MLLDGRTLAVAESCTAGLLAQRLASVEGSSEWFRGGVVAYMSEVKHKVLGVRSDNVVQKSAAIEMASGVARVLGSQVALSTTGIAGPEPADGIDAGTVILGWFVDGESGAVRLHLPGEPEAVIHAAVQAAIELLFQRLAVAQASAD